MRFKARRLPLIVLVAFFFVIWRGNTDQDVATAQGQKSVVVTRIFTGPDGLAQAEDVELKLSARGVSEMFKATGAEFSVRPPTAGADPNNTKATDPGSTGWHTGPARQFVITLSGHSEVESRHRPPSFVETATNFGALRRGSEP